MGTRGVFGFHKNGADKITYNHFDSYPTGLGEEVIKFLKKHGIGELNTIFDRIQMVNDETHPTENQIKECEKYMDLSVSTGKTDEWYVLLRNAQGNPEVYADGLTYMEDGGEEFLKDSLFCEWGYVINLTTNRLEIYRGFQKKSQDNRYKIEKPDGKYYNCALIREVPLTQVKNFNMEKFEKEIEKEEEE